MWRILALPKLAGLALGLVLVGSLAGACASRVSQRTGATPTSTPSGSLVGSPAISPAYTLPQVVSAGAGAAGLTCRLPIKWYLYSGREGIGFVSFPDLAVTADASAPATSLFYDQALSKWLPVWRNDVSPDGRTYAYQDATGKLHVVNAATGFDMVIYDGAPVVSVVDFAAEGIYVESASGLWLVDQTTGKHRVISATARAYTVGNGAAWVTDYNPADPFPASPVRGMGNGTYGPYNRILRVDLGTGAATPWFYQAGTDMNIMGADYSGHLFVAIGSRVVSQDPVGTGEVWVVAGPSAAKRVNTATVNKSSVALAHPWPPEEVGAVDRHGVWFDAPHPPALSSAVWLYSNDSFQKVAELSDNVTVAGGCI
jgi:hypothetical protein